MIKVEIANNLFLTFSVKENIKILKRNNIPFVSKINKYTQENEISFVTDFFGSNIKAVVSFEISSYTKFFGLKEIKIVSLDEDANDYFSNNSFIEMERVLENRYGLPEYCFGSTECVCFNLRDYCIAHTIYERKKSRIFHDVCLIKNKKILNRAMNLAFVKEMHSFVENIKPTDMKLLFLDYLNDNNLYFILEGESKGYCCTQNKKRISLTPIEIIREIDISGKKVISKKPLKDKTEKALVNTPDDVKDFLFKYFRQQSGFGT